jgi:hypothetical protein
MFLPSDTFYGYAQFDLAPPLEIDRTSARQRRQLRSANALQRIRPLHVLGLLEARPFGRGIFRHFMVFGQQLLFGKTVRRTYTPGRLTPSGSSTPGGLPSTSARFDVRFTQHFLFDRFGSATATSAPRPGANGPWGPSTPSEYANLRHEKMVN